MRALKNQLIIAGLANGVGLVAINLVFNQTTFNFGFMAFAFTLMIAGIVGAVIGLRPDWITAKKLHNDFSTLCMHTAFVFFGCGCLCIFFAYLIAGIGNW